MSNILSAEFVQTAIDAEKNGNQFPINFDDVWETLGYSRKDNTVRALLNSRVNTSPYILIKEGINKNAGNEYLLSLDGFKIFCLSAQTSEGQEVRKYFIAGERTYVQSLERQFAASAATIAPVPSEIYDEMSALIRYGKFCNRTEKDHLLIRLLFSILYCAIDYPLF
jgi:hypothetical protein